MIYYLDKKKLSEDVISVRKFNSLNTREAGKMAKVAHSTIQRVEQQKEIRIDTFIKVINWLKKKPQTYIKLKL